MKYGVYRLTEIKRKQVLDVKKVVICSIILLLIIAAIVFLCVFLVRRHKEQKNGETTAIVNVNDIVKDGEYVQIMLNDCSLYVGASMQLTCTSNPDKYAEGVIWKSSNPQVVAVTDSGMITVVSTGSAAITANYGVLSDSVVITAVVEGETVIDIDTPIYDVVEGQTVEVTITDSDNGNPVVPAPQGNVTTPTEPGTMPDGEKQTGAGSQPAQTTVSPEGENNTNEQNAGALILAQLPDLGYTKYQEDTYVYNEDGNYLGEVIVGDSLSQLYVKTRTTAFDNAIKEYLSILLPKGYNNVFASFISAAQDQTMSTDGYTVRIVVADGGGHSQIIIYY